MYTGEQWIKCRQRRSVGQKEERKDEIVRIASWVSSDQTEH